MLRLRNEDLEWRELDGEVVVLDAREGTYLAINGSGALLWPSLAEGATEEQLAGTLVDAYRIDAGRAKADAQQFIASLDARGLLAA